jgi:S-adenosylmethionine/arginine decarboxylase-like enzyme
VALHNHLLLNAKVNQPPADTAAAITWLTELVDAIDMKIVQGPFASYIEAEGNRGLTASVMIETSHIAFHVWDETEPGLLQFDLYTCSTLPFLDVLNKIHEFMDIQSYRYMILEREEEFRMMDKSPVPYYMPGVTPPPGALVEQP